MAHVSRFALAVLFAISVTQDAGATSQQDAEPIYITPSDANAIYLILADLPPASRRMAFDLAAIGAPRASRAFATVQGPLSDPELVSILKAVPIIHAARSIFGPWSLTIAANARYAHVTLNPLWSCRGNDTKGREWLLWNDGDSWIVRGEEVQLRMELCDPVE